MLNSNFLFRRAACWRCHFSPAGLLLLMTVLLASAVQAAPVYEVIRRLGNPDVIGTRPNGRLLLGRDGKLYGVTYRGGLYDAGTVYAVNVDGSEYRVLYHFGANAGDGYGPRGPLTEDSEGFLCGVTREGGSANHGTVFRLARTGGPLTMSRSLGTSDTEPWWPIGGLIAASDGMLYGASEYGGSTANQGTLFRLNRDGTGLTVLRRFENTGGVPYYPTSPIEGRDGLLYGTSSGGANDTGTIWRMNKNGSAFSIVRPFSNNATSARSPFGGIIEGSDGLLYGPANEGGTNGGGAIYRINRDGTGYTVIYNFPATGFRPPSYGLFEGADGYLYGVTTLGGTRGSGGIFRLQKTGGGFSVIHDLDLYINTWNQEFSGGPVYAAGRIVCPTYKGAILLGTLVAMNGDGTDFGIIHYFAGNSGTGGYPSTIDASADGKLYLFMSAPPGVPSVGSMNFDGSDFRYLRSFAGDVASTEDAPNRGPQNGLVDGGDGWMYAATYAAGANFTGSVARLSPAGVWETLYSFPAGPADILPSANLIPGPGGKLYGTAGRTGTGSSLSGGSVFSINRDGTGYTTLKQFATFVTEGSLPNAELLLASDGMFYGSTYEGGSANFGTVFRINPDGTGFQVIHHFAGGTGPRSPSHALTEGPDGLLYGVTQFGGSADVGTVFRLRKDGASMTVLRSFLATAGQHNRPYSRLILLADGYLHGVTQRTGTNSTGALFRIRLDGTGYATAHAFGGTDDGASPIGITLGGDGRLYGATSRGGLLGAGTIFRYGEAPELAVTSASSAPLISGAAVDAGTVEAGSSGTVLITVRNEGQLPLGPLTHEVTGEDFTASLSAATVPPGGSVALTLRFSPATPGPKSAVFRLLSNDFDEGSFMLALSGLAVSPEIHVHDGGDAAAAELTDDQANPVMFGSTRVPVPVTRSFYLRNSGTSALAISSLTAPSGYSFAPAPQFPLTIQPGSGTVLSLSMDAAAAGTFAGTVLIQSNDLDEANFDLPVTGTAVTPEITLRQGSVTGEEMADGQPDAVDFGRNIQGTPGSRTLVIQNTGSAPLMVSTVVVPPGFSASELSGIPFAVAPGSDAAFQIELTTPTVGTHSGSVIITSDDLDEAEFDFPITGEVFIPDPVASVASGVTTILNRQSGLREQTIRIANDTTATVPAYNLIIRGLPEGVEVNNASGRRADGSWVVYVRQAMNPRSSQDIILEYFSPNRAPVEIAPQVTTEVILNPPDLSAPGDGFVIDRVLQLEGGAVLIEFPTTPGRQYQVQYSHDGTTWQASLPAIRAAANRTQWLDRGLPRTDSHPSSHASRFYRVAELAP